MKIKAPEFHLDFVAGRVNYEEVLKYIRSTTSGKEFLQDNYGIALEIQLALCQSQNRRLDDLIPIYEDIAKNSGIVQSERDRAARVVEMMKQLWYRHFRGAEGCLGYLVQKIDLVSRFET